jgi:nucleoside-diphosphate-sugar epimerase
MKILVTGGGGFLGKAIIKQLLEKGHDVYSFSRSAYPELEEMGVTCRRGDLSKYEDVRAALEGMEAVFHVAALAGVWGAYEDYYNTNFVGTKNIVDAAKELGVTKIVHTSSPSTILDNDKLSGVGEEIPYPKKFSNHYAKTKAMAEQYVLKNHEDGKLHTVALRPHLIWGPGDPHIFPRIFEKRKKNLLKIVGDGKNQVDIIYVDNAARGHIQAFEKLGANSPVGGKVYFLGQNEPVYLWDFINEVLKRGGMQPVHKKVPFKVVYAVGFILEVIYRTFGIKAEPPMTRFVCNQMGKDHYFSHKAAKDDFGYDAPITTQEGLDRVFS